MLISTFDPISVENLDRNYKSPILLSHSYLEMQPLNPLEGDLQSHSESYPGVRLSIIVDPVLVGAARSQWRYIRKT
ncbi:MAG: hypothetical protein OEM26_07665 [Saprospiraceae bacterium]|nr:hypothetical protein [Saprospiraceae bacterium]